MISNFIKRFNQTLAWYQGDRERRKSMNQINQPIRFNAVIGGPGSVLPGRPITALNRVG